MCLEKIYNDFVFNFKLFLGTIVLSLQNIIEELEMLELLEQYQLEELEPLLAEKITAVLDMKTIFKVLHLADKHKCANLVESCQEFMDTHAEQLISCEEFYRLSRVYFINHLHFCQCYVTKYLCRHQL